MRLSVKGKLVIFTGGLIIVTMILTSFIIYSQLTSGIEESVEENATASIEEIDRYIQTYLDRYSITVSLLADDERTGDVISGAGNAAQQAETWNSLTATHESFMERESGAQLVYVGTQDGELVSTPYIDLPDDFDPRERPWYTGAMENPGEVVWTDPYIDVDTEELIITAARSVPAGNGGNAGVQAIDLSLIELVQVLETAEVGYNGELALIDSYGTVIAHTDTSRVGEDITEDRVLGSAVSSEQGAGSAEAGGFTVYYDDVDGFGWTVASVYSNNDLYAGLAETRNTFLIVSLIAVVIALAASYFAAAVLTKPIRKLNSKVKEMAAGDFSKDLNVKGNDEISDLGRAVNNMSRELRQLIGAIQVSSNESKSMAEELSAVSEETLATSDDMAAAVNEVAEGAASQAEDIDDANKQIRLLAEQVDRASEQSARMNSLSEEMKVVNNKGMEQMGVLEQTTEASLAEFQNADKAIQSLTQKVDDISQVVNTISDFADQTNLLALNASIEAARAGEHGRGFAVVADEVRKLAEQSINATEKIRSNLTEVENETDRVVTSMAKANDMSGNQQQAVEDTHASFTSIVKHIETLTTSLDELSVDLEGVNDQKEHILETIARISQVSEDSAATAEEVSASSSEQTKAIETVGTTADQLNDLSAELQEKTNRFKV